MKKGDKCTECDNGEYREFDHSEDGYIAYSCYYCGHEVKVPVGWRLVERFEDGQSRMPLLGTVCTVMLDGEKVYISSCEDGFMAWVQCVGAFLLPADDFLKGLGDRVEEAHDVPRPANVDDDVVKGQPCPACDGTAVRDGKRCVDCYGRGRIILDMAVYCRVTKHTYPDGGWATKQHERGFNKYHPKAMKVIKDERLPYDTVIQQLEGLAKRCYDESA